MTIIIRHQGQIKTADLTTDHWERGEQLPSQAALSKIAKLAEKAC